MITRLTAAALILLLLPLAAACGAQRPYFYPDGFHNPQHGYAVKYVQPDENRFVGEGWEVDNYKYDATSQRFSRRTGADYQGPVYVDSDNDGTAERSSDFYFDLKLAHDGGGVIWIRGQDQTKGLDERSLPELFSAFAQSLAVRGFYGSGNVYGARQVKPEQYTVKTSDVSETTLGDVPAVMGNIDLVPNAQREGAQPQRIKLLLARPVTLVDEKYRDEKGKLALRKVPKVSIVVAGYMNDASDFGNVVADFEKFLDTLKFATPPAATPAQ